MNFKEITDYVILLVYLMTKMQVPQSERLSFLNGYVALLDTYQRQLPQPIFSRFVHSQARQKLQEARMFIAEHS